LHSRALGITVVNSQNGRLVVTMTAAFSARSANYLEQKLSAVSASEA